MMNFLASCIEIVNHHSARPRQRLGVLALQGEIVLVKRIEELMTENAKLRRRYRQLEVRCECDSLANHDDAIPIQKRNGRLTLFK